MPLTIGQVQDIVVDVLARSSDRDIIKILKRALDGRRRPGAPKPAKPKAPAKKAARKKKKPASEKQ